VPDPGRDTVEDITWRFTFPVGSAGRIITPPNAPVGEVLRLDRGITIFAGQRRDPFFNFIPFPVAIAGALAAGTFPDLAALFPPTDSFLNNSVRSVLVEAPVEITGFRRLNYWATTAIYDQGHSTWLQLQRAGGPNTTTFWDFTPGVWGQLRDQTAAVVAAGGSRSTPPNPAARTPRRTAPRRTPHSGLQPGTHQ
jgi:hypothetical protein